MFNVLSVKSLKEFSSLEQYQYAEGFPVSPGNFLRFEYLQYDI